MAFCRLVLTLLVLSIAATYGKVHVPVFLWGDLTKSVKSNPLSSVPEKEFEAILHKELKSDPFTVIFIDETLSVEDFSLRNSDGETSYPYLHANIGKAAYLPAVEKPLTALKRLADPEKVDHVKLTENGLSAEFVPQSVKMLFITLKDAREGESRADMLRRHNDFMEEMFSKLHEEYGNVVAVYTARNPSWTVSESHHRYRREIIINSNNYTLDGLKLYVDRIILTVKNTTTNLTDLTTTSSELTEANMSSTLTFSDTKLTLNFVKKAGYWYFSTVDISQTTPEVVSESLQPETELFAPVGFSYRCGQNVTFTRVNDTHNFHVVFQDLKVQPFFTENGSLVFGDSINCVGFFSVPIWSGLFVVFILLSITFYGIMMMMDIRTMDRFDDPKGKTITINTAE